MRYLLLILLLFSASSTADPQKKAIDELLRDSNIENLLQLNQTFQQSILTAAIANLDTVNLPTLGSGDKVIYEFSDYQCGYCRHMFPLLENAADNDDITLTLIELPVLGAVSELAARYALAAHEQGKFAAFHRTLMNSNLRLDEPYIQHAAAQAQLDIARLQDYIYSAEADRQLELNYQLARLIGITGTPGFIINSNIYSGALQEEDFTRLIKEQ